MEKIIIMKKIKFLSIVFILFSAISFTSCSVEPIDSAIDLGSFDDGVDDVANFRAKIDGVDFSAINIIATYSDTSLGKQLSITANGPGGKTIAIQVLNPFVSTIPANITPNQLLVFQYQEVLLGINGSFSSYNSTANSSVGSITITNFDITNKKVSGVFNFTAFNSLNSSVTKIINTGIINNVEFVDTTTPNGAVAGSYLLTAFNTSVPTDLNGNGTASTNQMSETACFNNSFITLNTNNTFTADSKGIEIDLSVTPNISTCFTDPDYTGTWALNSNILTLTFLDGTTTVNENYTVVGNTLVNTVNNGQIVGSSGGNPIYVTSNITIIYSKQ